MPIFAIGTVFHSISLDILRLHHPQVVIMETQIHVENIRCGGCANSISKKLLENEQIHSVDVDIENQTVTVSSDNDVYQNAAATLLSLGYPEAGSVEGLDALKGKAKSVVSCAIGKMS